jgi:hypothetical protein
MPGAGHHAGSKNKKVTTKRTKVTPVLRGGSDGGGGDAGGDDSAAEPPPTPGGVFIDADVQVNRICEVNSREQDFTIIFSLTMHWHDPRIPLSDSLPLAETDLVDAVWKPNFYIPGANPSPRLQ